jgi:hypothetical protein
MGVAAGDSGAGLVPNVKTTRAVGIGQRAAVLLGFVNARGTETTVRFESGKRSCMEGRSRQGNPNTSTSGTNPLALKGPLIGFILGTLYHFRLVATSAAGTRFGKDETFRTLPRR